MRHVRMILTTAMFIVASLALPSVGTAAAAVPSLQTLRSIITPASQGGSASLIISGQLPDAASLPATVVVPIPKGLTPQWVGEILGGDPAKDPKATYSVTGGSSYDTVAIRVTASRTGQAEFTVPLTTSASGTTYAQQLPILGTVREATLEFRAPTGSKVSSASAGVALVTSTSGFDVYTLTRTSPRRGSTVKGSLVLAGSGTAAANGATAGSTVGSSGAPADGGPGSILGLVLVVLLAGGAGFAAVHALMGIRARRAGGAGGPGAPAAIPPTQAPRAARASAPEPSRAAKRPAPTPASSRAPHGRSAAPSKSSDGEAFDDIEPARRAASKDPTPAPETMVAMEKERPARRTASAAVESAFVEAPVPPAAPAVAPPASTSDAGDIVGHVKRLAALRTSGLLDDGEFAAAKQELLAGQTRVVSLLTELSRLKQEELLSEEEFGTAKLHLLAGSTETIVRIEELVALETQGLLSRDELRSLVDRVLA